MTFRQVFFESVFLERLELLDTGANLLVLIQLGQLLGDFALDPVDHVLALVLGQGVLNGDLKIFALPLIFKDV